MNVGGPYSPSFDQRPDVIGLKSDMAGAPSGGTCVLYPRLRGLVPAAGGRRRP